MLKLSNRVQAIRPSITLALAAKTQQLKKEGKPIISFSLGEPDFDTPDFIKKAACKAIEAGFTKYTAVEGILELRQAIAAKFERDNRLHYDPSQIIVSNGGKQCFYTMAQAFLNPGDEAIIPAPYWVSFPDMVILAGGNPVFIKTELKHSFKITPEQLEAAITKKTKLFVINSPSNPSGIAYTREELRKLGEVLVKHPDILIATDDMYEYIYWGKEPFCNIINACPELYDRSIILNAVSKTYAMTGWRIGYAAGPTALIQAMCTIQGQSTSNACSIAQVAAKAALEGDQSCVADMVKVYKERHDYVVEALNSIPGVQCLPGEGTFYLFPNIEGVLEKLKLSKTPLVWQGKTLSISTDEALAEYLLNAANLALTPGTAFGSPGHFRLSYATSMDNLKEGINRMMSFLT